jgi:hypothetical protein
LTLIDRPKSYQDRIKAVYKNKAMERVPMDPSFREGWAYHNDTAYMVHFFTPSTRGMLVSLCHQHRQYPIWVIPEEEGDIRCGHCIRVLERRQRVAKIRRERGLRRKLPGGSGSGSQALWLPGVRQRLRGHGSRPVPL